MIVLTFVSDAANAFLSGFLAPAIVLLEAAAFFWVACDVFGNRGLTWNGR